jgi:uncharacterized protein (DUF362 family)
MKSRRDLLQRAAYALGVVPYLALAPRSLLGSLLFQPDGPLVPAKAVPSNPFTRNGKALVALVHGQEPSVMLHEGMRLLGGLERLAVSGKQVLIKPNVVNDRAPPSITSPVVVKAVVQLLRGANPREIVVGDSSGMLRFPTRENLAVTGIGEAATTGGARLLALEEEPWVRVEPAQAAAVSRFYVSRPVYETDVLINLPVVKTHRFAHYSCSLKNLVGIIHPRYRPSLSFLSGDWHERIAELNLAVHPQLTIADGTTIMIAGGPTSGTAARPSVLLLSGDRVALDAVALALIRYYGTWPKVMQGSVWAQRQIRRAAQLGLGADGPTQMELVSETVSEPNEEFVRLTERIREDIGRV